MRKVAYYCDLCTADGYEQETAVARYWDVEGEEWDVCAKHLKLVKELGLEFEELE